jgi:hypothetical protein
MNRSVVRFKMVSGQLELLEYPKEPVPLKIEIEPLRHFACPLPVTGQASREALFGSSPRGPRG